VGFLRPQGVFTPFEESLPQAEADRSADRVFWVFVANDCFKESRKHKGRKGKRQARKGSDLSLRPFEAETASGRMRQHLDDLPASGAVTLQP